MPSRQANMAKSCWINFFIYSDITPSPGYLKGRRIFKMTAVALGPKIFSRHFFRAFKNRKRSGYVDCQQVRSINRNLFFFKLKLLILRRWWQLWMNLTSTKQRHGMNLFFVVFRFFVSRPISISKSDFQYRCTGKLITKTMLAYAFLCFSPLFSLFSSEIILKQVFATGSAIIGKYLPRLCLRRRIC